MAVASVAFEKALAIEIHTYLSAESSLAKLLPALSAADLRRVQPPFEAALNGLRTEQPLPTLAATIKIVRVENSSIAITLDPAWLMRITDIPQDQLNIDALTITRPFHLRRRGVETKVILGAIPAERDETLIANIHKAQSWYGQVMKGKGFTDISEAEGTERSRVQHMIGLAFLVPDIVERIANGTQPIGLTSEWVKRNAIPEDWHDQRKLFEAP